MPINRKVAECYTHMMGHQVDFKRNKVTLHQCLFIGGNFAPRRHSQCLGTFVVSQTGIVVVVLLASSGGGQDVVQHATLHKTAPQSKEQSGPNVNCTKVEKSAIQVIV